MNGTAAAAVPAPSPAPRARGDGLARGALALALALVLALSGWQFVERLRARPLASVRVAGEFRHLDRARLERAIAPHLRGGFFTVDVRAVRRAALALPWVSDASVRRVWPDSLHVAVVEREPVARWGEAALVQGDGAVFAPAPETLPGGLPALAGPPGTARRVLTRLRGLDTALAPIGERVRRLELTARRAWRVELSGGLVLLLGQDPEPAALARFVQAYPVALAPRAADIAQVDLRYANGFAVRWKSAAVDTRLGGGA